MRSLLSLLLAAVLLGSATLAAAAEDPHGAHGHSDGHGDHGKGHGDAHGGHHVPTFGDINWFYGVLGEREGVEPSFIYRPKGMPAPFGAYLLNAAVLYFILFRFLKKPVSEGLRKRKSSILKGMEEASRMRKDAEARLAEYEKKLANIDEEIERVRREMREDGEAERARILAEARVRRERMERDARLLVEQEFAAVREQLSKELISASFRSAAAALQTRVTADDQQRLADEYLNGLQKAGSGLRGGV
jgi:F-type H+-transporting ATPase subunit b